MSTEPMQSLPPGLLEALQRPSIKSASRLLNSFENVLEVCADPDNTGAPLNKYAIACPRPECGSLMLKTSTAKWVERASVQVGNVVYVLGKPSIIDLLIAGTNWDACS